MMFQKMLLVKLKWKRHIKIENVECIGINLTKEVKLWNAAERNQRHTQGKTNVFKD